MTTPEAISIIELAEAVKDLVRVLKCIDMPPSLDRRLDGIYNKVSEAKNRMENQ